MGDVVLGGRPDGELAGKRKLSRQKKKKKKKHRCFLGLRGRVVGPE